MVLNQWIPLISSVSLGIWLIIIADYLAKQIA